MERMLNDLRVRDVMVADPPTVRGRTSLREAALLLWKHGGESLLVLADDGAALGFLSERELVFGAEGQWQGLPALAGDHACARFVAAHPDDRFVDLLARLDDAAAKRALVLGDDGEPVGMISLAGGMVLDFLEPTGAPSPDPQASRAPRGTSQPSQ